MRDQSVEEMVEEFFSSIGIVLLFLSSLFSSLVPIPIYIPNWTCYKNQPTQVIETMNFKSKILQNQDMKAAKFSETEDGTNVRTQYIISRKKRVKNLKIITDIITEKGKREEVETDFILELWNTTQNYPELKNAILRLESKYKKDAPIRMHPTGVKTKFKLTRIEKQIFNYLFKIINKSDLIYWSKMDFFTLSLYLAITVKLFSIYPGENHIDLLKSVSISEDRATRNRHFQVKRKNDLVNVISIKANGFTLDELIWTSSHVMKPRTYQGAANIAALPLERIYTNLAEELEGISRLFVLVPLDNSLFFDILQKKGILKDVHSLRPAATSLKTRNLTGFQNQLVFNLNQSIPVELYNLGGKNRWTLDSDSGYRLFIVKNMIEYLNSMKNYEGNNPIHLFKRKHESMKTNLFVRFEGNLYSVFQKMSWDIKQNNYKEKAIFFREIFSESYLTNLEKKYHDVEPALIELNYLISGFNFCIVNEITRLRDKLVTHYNPDDLNIEISNNVNKGKYRIKCVTGDHHFRIYNQYIDEMMLGDKPAVKILEMQLLELINYIKNKSPLLNQPRIRIYYVLPMLIKFLAGEYIDQYERLDSKTSFLDATMDFLKDQGFREIHIRFIKKLFRHSVVQAAVNHRNILSPKFKIINWFYQKFYRKIRIAATKASKKRKDMHSIGTAIQFAYHELVKNLVSTDLKLSQEHGFYIIDYNSINKNYLDEKRIKGILNLIKQSKTNGLSIIDQIEYLGDLYEIFESLGEIDGEILEQRDLIKFKIEFLSLITPVHSGKSELAGSYLDQIRRLLFRNDIKYLTPSEFANALNLDKNHSFHTDFNADALIRALHSTWQDVNDVFIQKSNLRYATIHQNIKSQKGFIKNRLSAIDYYLMSNTRFHYILSGQSNGRFNGQLDTNYIINNYFGTIEYKQVQDPHFNDEQFRLNFVNSLTHFRFKILTLNTIVNLSLPLKFESETEIRTIFGDVSYYIRKLYEMGYLSYQERSIINSGSINRAGDQYIGIMIIKSHEANWYYYIQKFLDNLKDQFIDNFCYPKGLEQLRQTYELVMNPFHHKVKEFSKSLRVSHTQN